MRVITNNNAKQSRVVVLIILMLFLINSCGMLMDFNDTTADVVLGEEKPDTVVVDDGYWGASSSDNDRTVSRETGVAPLAVHFYSDFAAEKNREYRFRNYDYTWDFDDPSSGEWGTDGESKNQAKGALAVHVFNNPGIYNVSLTVRNINGIVKRESYTINVTDPDSYFSGNKTIYVSDTSQNDFAGTPDDSIKICTDNLDDVVDYAQPGCRILFDRGSSWTTDGLDWPDNNGPVNIGAYGTGTNPDSLGNYSNAPEITVTNGSFMPLSMKQNWRIMDLHLIDNTRINYAFNGSMDMQQLLFLRLNIDGFRLGFSWDHWNTSSLKQKDDIVISSCDVYDSEMACIYGGGERLAIIGNRVNDSRQSHVIRVWQAYRSVISHNIVTGSSLDTTQGKHALKLHGPGYYHNGEGTDSLGEPVRNTGLRALRTNFTIVSRNAFGSSGPWPVSIGPQNSVADERLTNLVFERNRIHADLGEQSSRIPELGLAVKCQNITVRNNIFDGTGGGNDYQGIMVSYENESLPYPTGIEIYNNTIYRGDTGTGIHRGMKLCSEATDIKVKNNLVSFPNVISSKYLMINEPINISSDANLITDNPSFRSPDNYMSLDRDFQISSSSPAFNAGVIINSVFEDYLGNSRDNFNIGAFE